MKMIQGIIALALVAAAVFIAVMVYDNKTEPGYIAKMHRETAALTGTVQVAKHAASQKAGALAGHKSKNANL